MPLACTSGLTKAVPTPWARAWPSSACLPSTAAFSTLATSASFSRMRVDDPPALLDVLQLAAAEQHVDQHLVLVLQELAGLVDLGVDVVVAGLGADADLLQLLLVDLRSWSPCATAGSGTCRSPGSCRPAAARWRPPRPGRGWPRGPSPGPGTVGHDAELLAVGADQADGADADLLVDPRAAVVRRLRMTVGRRNTLSPLLCSAYTPHSRIVTC